MNKGVDFSGLRVCIDDINPPEYGTKAETVAYHESGHAVAAVVLGLVLEDTQIIYFEKDGNPWITGKTQWRPRESFCFVEDEVAVFLCGMLSATKSLNPQATVQELPFLITDETARGAMSDLRRGEERITQYETDGAEIDQAVVNENIVEVIERNWTAIQTVADSLLADIRVPGHRVAAIVESFRMEKGQK